MSAVPDPTSPSAARKALDYAETTLGVNETYDHAVEALGVLHKEVEKALAARAEKRSIDEQIDSRTMDLTIEEAGRHTDMSVAAMERHMKIVLSKDDTLKQLRAQQAVASGTIEYQEYQIKIVEADVRVVTSRLTELGGYFNYLAAVKLAQTANKA